jgi:hypothetical protein
MDRAGRVAQVTECLPSKCESLSSNPKTTKKENVFFTWKRELEKGTVNGRKGFSKGTSGERVEAE